MNSLNKVRGFRTMVGMTQEEMAKELGVSINTYRAYEDNPEKMSVEIANKFIGIINKTDNTITMNDIFSK
jgi:DNA-binding XRE family transcriptional regulator